MKAAGPVSIKLAAGGSQPFAQRHEAHLRNCSTFDRTIPASQNQITDKETWGSPAANSFTTSRFSISADFTMSYLQASGESIWAEEESPYFVDVVLQSYDAPINDKIYVMYHGTTVECAETIIRNGFRRSPDGMLGPGVYVSRAIEKARQYPIGMEGRNVVLKLRVNVGKVKRIDRQGHPLQKNWQSQYNSAWVPPKCGMVRSGLEEDCIADPTRIKVIDVAFAPHYHLQRLKQLI